MVCFTPLPGCFSPFPRGTLRYRSTQVFSLGEWSPLLPTGYLVPRGTRVADPPPGAAVDHGALTLSGGSFQILRLATPRIARTRQGPPVTTHNPPPATPAGLTRTGFGLFPVRSPLLGESFLFLGVLRCFSSPTYLRPVYVFNRGCRAITRDELPHSGIDGALPTCGPPSLFAACRALHRPVSPRHPPRTVSYVSAPALTSQQNSDHANHDPINHNTYSPGNVQHTAEKTREVCLSVAAQWAAGAPGPVVRFGTAGLCVRPGSAAAPHPRPAGEYP